MQLFAGKRDPKPVAEHADPEALYSQIGKLKMELDWLKKSPGSACERAAHLDHHGARSGTRSHGSLEGIGCPGKGRRGRRAVNTLSAHALRLGGRVSRHRVRAAARRRGRCDRPGALPAHRRPIHPSPVLRHPVHGAVSAQSRAHRQQKARAAAHARHGARGHGARPQRKPPQHAPGAQNLPVPAAGVAITRPNQVWSTDINPAFAGAGSTSVSTTDSRIWWPSWIGTDAACCLGVSATAWMRRSA